jgi:hypothetical protein
MVLVKMDQRIPPCRNHLPKPACCALLRAACGVCCGMGRVFVDVYEREEACVKVNVKYVMSVVVDGQNSTQRAYCPKLNDQPGATIYANYSRPP